MKGKQKPEYIFLIHSSNSKYECMWDIDEKNLNLRIDALKSLPGYESFREVSR